MAYATPDQLAEALRDKRLVTTAPELLARCLGAAAEEIDADLDRIDPLPDPPPAMVIGVNVNRAVEWFKAADAFNGGIGTEQTGVLPAPESGFNRYSLTLRPLKQRWGVA